MVSFGEIGTSRIRRSAAGVTAAAGLTAAAGMTADPSVTADPGATTTPPPIERPVDHPTTLL